MSILTSKKYYFLKNKEMVSLGSVVTCLDERLTASKCLGSEHSAAYPALPACLLHLPYNVLCLPSAACMRDVCMAGLLYTALTQCTPLLVEKVEKAGVAPDVTLRFITCKQVIAWR